MERSIIYTKIEEYTKDNQIWYKLESADGTFYISENNKHMLLSYTDELGKKSIYRIVRSGYRQNYHEWNLANIESKRLTFELNMNDKKLNIYDKAFL